MPETTYSQELFAVLGGSRRYRSLDCFEHALDRGHPALGLRERRLDFGGVTIDWGDGTPAQGGASTGPTTHIYDLAPGQTQVFEIRITSNEGTGRSVSKSVTITAPPVDP